MEYTVKQLARISGVTVRTLHHYDELGLLKPARYGSQGYRYYEYAQLMKLQQILFYRELGFGLDRIRTLVGSPRFDPLRALESHRETLFQEWQRLRKLITTLDDTVRHMKSTKKMKDKALFQGFDPKRQDGYERQLIDRYGPGMRVEIDASRRRVKHWTKADWERSGQEFSGICRDLVQVMLRSLAPEAPATQVIVRRHFDWMKQFWTPTRESYAGHGQFLAESELRHAYAAHHPSLPEYAAAAIKAFAHAELAPG